MLSCKEVSRLLSLAQEQKLSLWDKVQLKMHIIICKYCRCQQTNLNMLREISQAHAKREQEK